MVDNTGVAPICNGKAIQPTFTQKISQIPTFSAPSPSLPALVQAILQLQQAIQTIAGNNVTINNTINGIPGTVPANGGAGQVGLGGGGGGKKPAKEQWSETARVTQDVKVVNPDDSSQFVIVREIVSLTFTNSVTNEEIIWQR